MSEAVTLEQLRQATARSSFYAGMRILPRAEREAMFAIYGFCRLVDDIADDTAASREYRGAALRRWREDVADLYRGGEGGKASFLRPAIDRFGLEQADFLAVIEGMQLDADADLRWPPFATLDYYCDCVASAVGRLSVRVFGMEREPGLTLAHHLGRALQFTNVLRDIDEDAGIERVYLPIEALQAAGIVPSSPLALLADPRLDPAARWLATRAAAHFAEADAILARRPQGPAARTQADGGKLFARAGNHAAPGLAGAAPARLDQQAAAAAHCVQALAAGMRAHVVGAGLAGLSAAVELARAGVQVHLAEAAPRAGGRCRSYHDPQLGQTIDNGNHFTFSGNRAVARYLETIGSAGMLEGPEHATFAFHDLADGSRWTLDVNDGALPWWVLSRRRRAPGTRLADHLALARLALARRDGRAIGDVVATEGAFWRRVVEPMMLAVLNCPADQGSAWLAGRFLRESFVRGGRACRTMVAMPSLDAAFVDPALAWLRLRGVTPRFGARLRALAFDGDRVTALDYGDGPEPVHDAAVVLAVPPWIAGELVPGLAAPDRFCAILNAHYAIRPPAGAPPITALLGATAQWVVCHPDRISVTISGADDLIDADRESLARTIWREICDTLGIAGDLPAWQIVKEKRATFAATPAQDALRPGQATRWRNLFLAGDWVQTGLPATIEGALRSGHNAACLALGRPLVYEAPR